MFGCTIPNEPRWFQTKPGVPCLFFGILGVFDYKSLKLDTITPLFCGHLYQPYRTLNCLQVNGAVSYYSDIYFVSGSIAYPTSSFSLTVVLHWCRQDFYQH